MVVVSRSVGLGRCCPFGIKSVGEDGVRVVGEAWRVGRYYSEECLMCHGKGCMSDN